jgi:hypothetical protein
MVSPETHRAVVDRVLDDAAPVRRLWRPSARLALWLAAGLGTLIALAARGVRPDFTARAGSPHYLFELVLLGGAATLAAALALRAAVPGRELRRWESILVLALAAFGSLLWLRQSMGVGLALDEFIAVGLPCARETVALAAVPCIGLLIAVRRGAPLAVGSAGALAGGASFLLAFVMMRIVCSVDDRTHVLVWHAVPVVIGTGLAAIAGLVWFPRWRRSLR